MKRITQFIIVLIFTSSCKIAKTDVVNDSNYSKEFPFNDSTYTILNEPSGWKRVFKDSKPTSLTESELMQIEEIIKIAIKEYNLKLEMKFDTENEKHLKNNIDVSKFQIAHNEHFRQYLPVINQNGEKEIWINFFCINSFPNWKNQIVCVFDGGNCYFNLKVNLTTNSYSELIVNGYA